MIHKITISKIITTAGTDRYLLDCACGAMGARDTLREIYMEIGWHFS